MTRYILIILISVFPQFAAADSHVKEKWDTLKIREKHAACAVAHFMVENEITQTVKAYIQEFREREIMAGLFSDKSLLEKGKKWMHLQGYNEKISSIVKICDDEL